MQAIRQFARWLVVQDRLERYPLGGLRFGNVSLDIRRKRRALTPDEAQRLREAARNAGTIWCLPGVDRSMLYTIALSTGLRARELGSLTPESFDLEAGTVVVEAGYSKHRRKDTLPLHPDLVEELRPWLAGRAGRLWPSTWYHHSARMFRRDLEAAGIPYETSQGVSDFHSLRHSFITHLVRSGVRPKVCQALARHASITLTMDRYAHLEREVLAEAVRGIPPLARRVVDVDTSKEGQT